MKKYTYVDPGGEYTLTEEEILNQYFDYWSTKMKEAGKEDLISKENCIQDWVVVNWATVTE